jgi:hypothetical protein
MANNTGNPQPSTMAPFRPASTLAHTLGTAHGTKTTMNIQQFVTPVKLEFNVPSSQNALNLNKKSHLVVLNLLKEKDPTM